MLAIREPSLLISKVHTSFGFTLLLALFISGCELASGQSATTASPLGTDNTAIDPTMTVDKATVTKEVPQTISTVKPSEDKPSLSPTIPVVQIANTLIEDDFIFAGESESCVLPCWNGLSAGVSGRGEIEATLMRVLQLDPKSQVFPNDLGNQHLQSQMRALGFDVRSSTNEKGFGLNVYYDVDSYILQGISFSSAIPTQTRLLSPQRIVRELGQPTTFLMHWGVTGDATLALIKIRMVYEKGIVFTIHKHNPITFNLGQSGYDGSLELCLGGAEWQEEGAINWRVSLVPPLKNGLENMTPNQARIITFLDSIDNVQLYSVSDFFRVTDEYITDLATNNDKACLFTEFSEQISTNSP